MLENIGSVAGTVWRYLEENSEATVTKLTRELGENERTVLMAIGWLAREGKLDFEKRKQGTYITLKNTTIRRSSGIDFGRRTDKKNEATSSVNSGAYLTPEP